MDGAAASTLPGGVDRRVRPPRGAHGRGAGRGPGTLMELCGRVHAAYGGLPADRVRDLAMTVDGHLADLVAARRATISPGPPRVFA